MKTLKLMSTVVLMTMFLLTVAACGAPAVTMTDVPVFPGATVLETGQNEIADAASDGLKQALSSESVTAEVQMYALPAGTNWDEVTQFYNDKLASTDWKTSADIAQDTEFFKVVGWTRGSFNSEQALGVGYGPEMLGNQPFLMIALMSE
jgi:hypothetical protein